MKHLLPDGGHDTRKAEGESARPKYSNASSENG
jgi:hypothetical protein